MLQIINKSSHSIRLSITQREQHLFFDNSNNSFRWRWIIIHLRKSKTFSPWAANKTITNAFPYKMFQIIFLLLALSICIVSVKHHFTYLTMKIILSAKCNTPLKLMHKNDMNRRKWKRFVGMTVHEQCRDIIDILREDSLYTPWIVVLLSISNAKCEYIYFAN